VTQATIGSTICVSGWTATVRPSSSFTTALKIKQIVQYGYSDTKTSSYEEDHLIPLELGGAPADARNLWPEPYTVTLADGRSTGARTKDPFETKLKSQVCAGTITLAQAQGEIGIHWAHSYYGIALVASPTTPAPTAAPTARATSAPTKPATTAAPTAHVTSPPATPVATAPTAKLSVTITSLPASVAPSADATMVAVTSPGATCTPRVKYASGTVSKAQGLIVQVADASGSVTWKWTVGPSTGAGTSTASVTCSLGGASASASQNFVVS
jgi:hypothetical protein